MDDGVKVDNKQLFYTIEVLNEAIEKGLKVEFQYNVYDINKKLKPKKDGKIYKVNPYYMVNNKQLGWSFTHTPASSCGFRPLDPSIISSNQ